MRKFCYNLFLLVFVVDKDSIQDAVIGTTIFLVTGKAAMAEDEYLALKRNIFESSNYHYVQLGMKLGKFFFKRALCKKEEEVEVERITSSMIYGCFQDVVECNLSTYIKNICRNKIKINDIICRA